MKALKLSFIVIFMIFFLAACGRKEEDLPTEFNTDLTDNLEMDFSYEMDAFLSTGVGQVVLISCEDGDTAVFRTEGVDIRVRFIGIDAPEASGEYEPWGYQSTQFACERLDNAEVIVLEYDPAAGSETYGRELAYVWYDGRLLNLELVEKGYAVIFGVSGHKYETEFNQADRRAKAVGGRVHETENTDPLWDYSREPQIVSLEDLVNSPEDYAFALITVEGVITREYGNHAYIEDEGYGMYVFLGHSHSSKIEEGNRVQIEGVRFINDLLRRNGWHITGLPTRATQLSRAITVLEENVEITPHVIEINEINETYFGRFVRLNQVTIKSIDVIDTHSVIFVEDSEGNTLILEQASLVIEYQRGFDFTTLTPGTTFDVKGIIVNSIEGPYLKILDSNDIILD